MRALLHLCPALISGLMTAYASPVLEKQPQEQLGLQLRIGYQPSDRHLNEGRRKPPPDLLPDTVEELVQGGKHHYNADGRTLPEPVSGPSPEAAGRLVKRANPGRKLKDASITKPPPGLLPETAEELTQGGKYRNRQHVHTSPKWLRAFDPAELEWLQKFFRKVLVGACKSCLRECIEERGLEHSYDCPEDCTTQVRREWQPGTYKEEYRDGEDPFQVPLALGPMVNDWSCYKTMAMEYGEIPDERPGSSTNDGVEREGPAQANSIRLEPDSDLRRPFLTSQQGGVKASSEDGMRSKTQVVSAGGGGGGACKQFLAGAKISSLSAGCDIRPQHIQKFVSQLGERVKDAVVAPPPKPPFKISVPAPPPLKLGSVPIRVVP
ncbi:MAG: hypothetical protein M1823_006091 [Watsoniomyces obsoletus]|nr:MAG: hypothetical protein M1823_006091 [Watsoniomyces obsoletus]